MKKDELFNSDNLELNKDIEKDIVLEEVINVTPYTDDIPEGVEKESFGAKIKRQKLEKEVIKQGKIDIKNKDKQDKIDIKNKAIQDKIDIKNKAIQDKEDEKNRIIEEKERLKQEELEVQRLKLEEEENRKLIDLQERERKANEDLALHNSKEEEKLRLKEEEKQRKLKEYTEYKNARDYKKQSKKKRKLLPKILGGFALFVLILFIIISKTGLDKESTGTMGYLKFVEEVSLQKIEKVQLVSEKSKFFTVIYKEGIGLEEQKDSEGNVIELEIKDNKRIEKVINPQTPDFIMSLITSGIGIEYKETTAIVGLLSVLVALLPTLLIFGILGFYMFKVFGNQLGNGGGKGEVTIKENPIMFEDVAGMKEEKEELLFAIKTLTDKTYKNMGIKPIRGILLEGPPGVGKTMIAKAVANEAGLKFLSYSGSDFVEMYVGMGANRIRSMYKRAEELAPCIIFIDEIDALGRRRSVGGDSGTQESDQTLIALLEKMDGMNTDKKIMFIGATNRSDMLDNALVRPGRFDKIIHIGAPKTKEDREAIVGVHLKGKTLEEGVTIEQISKHCYGLTGAEIASVMNDAVSESIRGDRVGIIGLQDIDRATMKLISKGLAKGRHLSADLERVSIHELGHAVMNREVGRKVVKVSVQPYSSGIGGVTVIDSESIGISGLRKASDLRNDIKVLYSGKVAEEVLLGECSIGASNDLDRATMLLRDYVGAYGMKEGSILSLVGLSRENMAITANEKLLNSMEEVGQDIYKEVVSFISSEITMNYIIQLTEKLMKEEVIYNFDEQIDIVDKETVKQVLN